jgi:plasmid stabilization system protein ParE
MPQHVEPRSATPWDFEAALNELLVLQGTEAAWKRWDDLRDAAEQVVAEGKASGAGELRAWLEANAEALIGQQLLVRAVHRKRDAPADMTHVLHDWLSQASAEATASDAVAWLQREEPALMRAWMLTLLPELVGRELERLRSASERSTSLAAQRGTDRRAGSTPSLDEDRREPATPPADTSN